MTVAFLKKHWFLVGLVGLVSSGLGIGVTLPPELAERLSGYIDAKWITRAVLFLMAFSLDSAKLRASVRFPNPVLCASVINSGAIPLAAWGLMSLQQDPSFEVGLMIAASVPCTLAAVSVWTRKAGGNDAVSLLTTLLTNTLCFVVTPFWLNLALRGVENTGGVELGVGPMVTRLLGVVLVPTILGQACRMIPAAREFAVAQKSRIGIAAQGMILVLVFTAAALKAGPQLGAGGIDAGAIGVVWGCCLGLHLAAMAAGAVGGRMLGLSREDRIAVLFGSSQKTLPIGVYLATSPEMFGSGSFPFAVFPMLMFHATQLFVDTIIADRIAASAPGEERRDPETDGPVRDPVDATGG